MAMPPSRSELHTTDSPVSWPLDSSEALSEPPDIRNWFPSYTYESPELNTLDGLRDLDGSKDEHIVDKSNHGLLYADNIEHVEMEHRVPAALVTGSSESLSFSSEPPDIKNWFSSYLYESPPLDSTLDFTVTDYKVREDGKVCKSGKLGNKDCILIGVEESSGFPTQTRLSQKVGVKCINLVKDIKVDCQAVDKDADNNVALKPTSSIPSLLTSEIFSKQILPGQRTMNKAEEFGDTNTYVKDSDGMSECSLSERTNLMLLSMENYRDGPDGKYVFKSVGRTDRVKNSLENKDPREIASLGNLDSTVAKGESWCRPADSRSARKETELVDNGFVSTRKRNKENAGNLTNMPPQVQTQSLRREAKPALTRSRTDASITRKVLSEISNNSSPARQESSGKWCCPQKNKPNLGPPLKQLRLEQWVRRV